MNPNSFFFKLSAIFFQYLLLICIAFPIIYLIFFSLSDFNSDKVVFIRILFFSIALALPFVMVNAFAYAGFKNFELKNYLKPHQRITVKIADENLNDREEIKSNLQNIKNWTFLKEENNCLLFSKSNILIKDKIAVCIIKSEDKNTEIKIDSKPSSMLVVIDFARNYKNIITVLKAIKKH